jgi:hypothetical protein
MADMVMITGVGMIIMARIKEMIMEEMIVTGNFK